MYSVIKHENNYLIHFNGLMSHIVGVFIVYISGNVDELKKNN